MRPVLVTSMLVFSIGCGGSAAETRNEPAPAPAPPPQTMTASTRGGEGITREAFLAELRPLTGSLFCTPEAYFRQCFAVTEADCHAFTAVAFDSCAAQLVGMMPPVLYSESDGAAAGEMMGTCAGGAYDQGLAARGLRYDTPVCNDPSNWGG